MKPILAFCLYTSFLLSVLYLTSCSSDDPIPMFERQRNLTVENSETAVDTSTTTLPVVTETTIYQTMVPILEDDPSTELYNYPIIQLITQNYMWMQRSDEVAVLQEYLQVPTDGVYGPQTKAAHTEALQAYGLETNNVPIVQSFAPSSPKPMRDNVPEVLLTAIQSFWPQNQWARAVEVAWCESRFIETAKNPTSTASGYFQLLRPWTKDREDTGQVWGWLYDESGKLSAAAGLGITEQQARFTIRNVEVAYEIWWRGGNSWSPWNASRHCWN